MKKLLIGIGGILALVIAAAVIVPFFIPVERYKSEITERTRAATGRDLVIEGPLSVTLFPSIGLTADGVRFSNAPGGRAANLAELDRLRLSVRLLPLLTGNLEIDGFELINPMIHFEVDNAGVGNWVLAEAGAPPPTSQDTAGGGAADFSFLQGLSLENVRLVDGTVTYYDAATGETTTLGDINASLSLPAFDETFAAKGEFTWQGEAIALDLTLANLKAFLDGEAQNFRTSVTSAPISLSMDGTARMADSPAIDGRAELDIPSIRELAAWAGSPLDMPGTGLGPLRINGVLSYAGSKIAFSDASIFLDDMQATGNVALATDGPRPYVEGRLDVATLDLNPYLPPAEEEETELVWSEEPIDASGLQAADLDFSFTAQAIKVMGVTTGPGALDLDIKDGVLTAGLTEMQLYGGNGSGEVRLDGRQPALGLTTNFDLKGVAAEPLLQDAVETDRLAGTFTTGFALTASGRSQKDIVSTLDGEGTFEFLDGEIRGVDLAKVASTIERVVNGFQEGGGNFLSTFTSGNIVGSLQAVGAMFGAEGQVNETTKFTSMTGSWTATDGVFNNPDLDLVGPLVNDRAVLRMTGAGSIDLPDQTLNYEAQIRSFPEAQDETGGIGGTVRLAGAMTEPDPCVVVGSLCIGSDTKPAEIAKQKLLGDTEEGSSPQERIESIGRGIRGLFGGDKSEE